MIQLFDDVCFAKKVVWMFISRKRLALGGLCGLYEIKGIIRARDLVPVGEDEVLLIGK